MIKLPHLIYNSQDHIQAKNFLKLKIGKKKKKKKKKIPFCWFYDRETFIELFVGMFCFSFTSFGFLLGN